MSLSTGLDAQVGIAQETAWGTYTAPTLFVMFTSEDVKRSAERVEAEGIRPGALVAHEDDWEEGRVGAEGPLEFEWPDRGMSMIGKAMLGKVTHSQPDPSGAPTVWQHVCEVFPLDGQGLTFQVGRPDNSGTVKAWSYVGGKVLEWEISNEVDGLVVASLTFDFQNEDRTRPLAAKSFAANLRKLAWVGGVVTLDGTEAKATDVKFSGKNPLRPDRFFIQSGAELKDEQLEGDGLREYEGSVTMEYSPAAEAIYDKFVSGAPVAVAAEWQGRTISGTHKYGLKVEAGVCRVEGETPTVGGAEAIESAIPFVVKSNGTDSAIKFTLTDDQPGT